MNLSNASVLWVQPQENATDTETAVAHAWDRVLLLFLPFGTYPWISIVSGSTELRIVRFSG
jgi:hypothetical protein